MKRIALVAFAALAASAASAKLEKLAEISVADTSVLIRHAAKLGQQCGVPLIGMVAAQGIQQNVLSEKFGPMREGECLTAVLYGDTALLMPTNFEAFAMTVDLTAVYPCDMTKEKFLEVSPEAVATNDIVVIPEFDRITFSPDGKWAAMGASDESARLVLAEAGKLKVRDGLATEVHITEHGIKALSMLTLEVSSSGERLDGVTLRASDKAMLEYIASIYAQVKDCFIGFGVGDLGIEVRSDVIAFPGTEISLCGENAKKGADLLAFAGKDSLVAVACSAGSGMDDQAKAVERVLEFLGKNGLKTDFFKSERNGSVAKYELDVAGFAKAMFGEWKEAIDAVKDPKEFIEGLNSAASVICASNKFSATPEQAISFSVKGKTLATTPGERFAKALPELKDKPLNTAVVVSAYALCRIMADGFLAAAEDSSEVRKFKNLMLTIPEASDSCVTMGSWKEGGVFKGLLRVSPDELKSFTSSVMLIVTTAMMESMKEDQFLIDEDDGDDDDDDEDDDDEDED